MAFSLLIKTNAAAPSLMVEALAAVTVPSLENAGRKLGILSINTFEYSSSSVTIFSSPRLCGTATGITSLSNLPFSQASEDLLYD